MPQVVTILKNYDYINWTPNCRSNWDLFYNLLLFTFWDYLAIKGVQKKRTIGNAWGIQE